MSETSELRVSVVEDDRATREGLKLLLDGTPGFRSAGLFESVEEALAERMASPDVIVLDVNLRGCRGPTAWRRCASATRGRRS